MQMHYKLHSISKLRFKFFSKPKYTKISGGSFFFVRFMCSFLTFMQSYTAVLRKGWIDNKKWILNRWSTYTWNKDCIPTQIIAVCTVYPLINLNVQRIYTDVNAILGSIRNKKWIEMCTRDRLNTIIINRTK